MIERNRFQPPYFNLALSISIYDMKSSVSMGITYCFLIYIYIYIYIECFMIIRNRLSSYIKLVIIVY